MRSANFWFAVLRASCKQRPWTLKMHAFAHFAETAASVGSLRVLNTDHHEAAHQQWKRLVRINNQDKSGRDLNWRASD